MSEEKKTAGAFLSGQLMSVIDSGQHVRSVERYSCPDCGNLFYQELFNGMHVSGGGFQDICIAEGICPACLTKALAGKYGTKLVKDS